MLFITIVRILLVAYNQEDSPQLKCINLTFKTTNGTLRGSRLICTVIETTTLAICMRIRWSYLAGTSQESEPTIFCLISLNLVNGQSYRIQV